MASQSCPHRMEQFVHRPLYRDFANIFEHDLNATSTMKSDKFPVKLHYVLSDMEQEGLEHIASWQTHGRCFFVHDKKLFTQKILPFWFRQSKFDSFQRQLNIYGFVRITSGPDKGGYYHKLFLRGKLFLASGIQRNHQTRCRSAQEQAHAHNLDLYQFPSLPSGRNSKQLADGFVSSSISRLNDPPLNLLKSFKSSCSMKGPDLSANQVSTPTRELERTSSMMALLNAQAVHTITTPWPRRQHQLSLVDMMLAQQLMNQDSPGACSTGNL